MGEINRGLYAKDIAALMLEHNLSDAAVIYVIATSHGLAWVAYGNVLSSLYAKKFHDGVNLINLPKFFKIFEKSGNAESFDTPIVNTLPKGLPKESVKIADKYFDRFVSPKEQEKLFIEQYAKIHFLGDFYVAKYFLAYRGLFPRGVPSEDIRWNNHFGVAYRGRNKWEESKTTRRAFERVFKKYDIGHVLSATYLAVENSLERKSHESYMQKSSRFLTSEFEMWYDIAVKDYKKRQKKKAETPTFIPTESQKI